jgi:hypothetical protein
MGYREKTTKRRDIAIVEAVIAYLCRFRDRYKNCQPLTSSDSKAYMQGAGTCKGSIDPAQMNTREGLVLVQIQFFELPRQRSCLLEVPGSTAYPTLGPCSVLIYSKWRSSPKKFHEVQYMVLNYFPYRRIFCNQFSPKNFFRKKRQFSTFIFCF